MLIRSFHREIENPWKVICYIVNSVVFTRFTYDWVEFASLSPRQHKRAHLMFDGGECSSGGMSWGLTRFVGWKLPQIICDSSYSMLLLGDGICKMWCLWTEHSRLVDGWKSVEMKIYENYMFTLCSCMKSEWKLKSVWNDGDERFSHFSLHSLAPLL